MSLTDYTPQVKLLGGSLAVGVALAIAAAVFQECRGPSQLSPSVRDSIAAVAASKHADSVAHATAIAHADSAAASSTRSGIASDRLDVQSRASEQHGIQLRRAGDSLAALARVATTAQDSAARLWDAWRAERAHGDTLTAALVTERASRDSMRVSRDSARASALYWKRADSVSTSRLDRVERLNADLKKDAERLSSGCRVLPFVPCPSRKALAIAGVAAAVLVHERDTRAHPSP